jgi:hypothetical protein
MGFMLKNLLILAFGLMISGSIVSQEVERIHRVGLRGVYRNDPNTFWGAEFSYQIKLKGMRRLEMDMGWLESTSWDLFQITGIYQWQLIRKGGFSFYTGPGLGFGYAGYGYGEDRLYGLVAANVGVDYTFRLPLQIAIDWRPEYSILNQIDDDITNQFGFAIRLAF